MSRVEKTLPTKFSTLPTKFSTPPTKFSTLPTEVSSMPTRSLTLKIYIYIDICKRGLGFRGLGFGGLEVRDWGFKGLRSGNSMDLEFFARVG